MFEALIKMWLRKFAADEDKFTFAMPLLLFSPGPFFLLMGLFPSTVNSQFMREFIMDFKLLVIGVGSMHTLVFVALLGTLIAAMRRDLRATKMP